MNATLQGQRSDNTSAQANGLGPLPPHKFQGLKARNNAVISHQIIGNPNSLHTVERIGRHDLLPAGERIDFIIKPTTLRHQIPPLPPHRRRTRQSWITDNALYVEYMKRPMDPVYLVDALRFANLNQYAGQAGQPLISASRIYPVEINDPPPDQQASYAAIVNKTQGKIQKSTALLQEAETLFSSLQQRAFRGEL